MNKNRDTKEKICAFYASDYHFEMISLPYINKKIENKNEIIILTENDLEESMKTLLRNITLKEEKKEEILKLDWKNNDAEKFDIIKTKMNEEKNIIIFVKGNKNYIHGINQNIEKWMPEKNYVKIIDCYNIEEVGDNLDKVMGQYEKVLRVTGEKEIAELQKNSC